MFNIQSKSVLFIDLDECEKEPCQNGGTCSTPQFDMFSCVCVAGFTGEQCETGKLIDSLQSFAKL